MSDLKRAAHLMWAHYDSVKCDHVFGPYFRRMPFKVYWVKCYKCAQRHGPFWSLDSLMSAYRKRAYLDDTEETP